MWRPLNQHSCQLSRSLNPLVCTFLAISMPLDPLQLCEIYYYLFIPSCEGLLTLLFVLFWPYQCHWITWNCVKFIHPAFKWRLLICIYKCIYVYICMYICMYNMINNYDMYIISTKHHTKRVKGTDAKET